VNGEFLTGECEDGGGVLEMYCFVAEGKWLGWFLNEPFVGDVFGELAGELPLRTPLVAALRSP
jgi:hypothetical protein